VCFAHLLFLIVGKQVDTFKHPIAADANTNKCMTLVSKQGSQPARELNLESETTEQLSSFLFGLQSLLNKGGRNVMVDEASAPSGQQRLAGAGAGGAPPPRPPAAKRFSIMSANPADLERSRYKNFKKGLLALPQDVNLRTMTEGRDFYVWEVDDITGRVYKKLQHVYYVSEADTATASGGGQKLRLGAFYWNDVGKKEMHPTRRMVIGDLTDVFVGKQTVIMNDPAASSANSKCCVTFVDSASRQLNLEAMSPELANTFLAGVNGVLTAASCQVVLEESKPAGGDAGKAVGGVAKKSKRYSILAPPSLPGVNTSDPSAVAMGHADGVLGGKTASGPKQTVLGVATHEAITAMSEGRRYIRWSRASNDSAVVKNVVTLFYVKESHSLFWAQPGSRAQDPRSQLKFDELTDVFRK